MPRISELTDIDFDGVNNPYVPPKELRISPKLKLHRDWTRDIDPVTYEVIRHNLWQINEEHGATIQRLSGSPVAMYALDLNPSLLTEDAEFVYFGPYMQYMSGVTDTQVKWTLEFRSDNPGINEGDMFLANDPWVGAAHQQDVMLLCPVFWEGELFCWVTNCLHQYDIGGITPGSFCPSAESAYDEGIMLPPIKIIERGEVRRDIEAVYLRASRKPQLVALDFRAQIAGNSTARDRVLELIRRYGAATVKGVMKQIIDNSEKAYLEKMKRVPDSLAQHAGSGERGLIVDTTADRDGWCRVGLLNEKLKLGVEISYPKKAMPRLANWQHYGPRGSYVAGLEPFSGSLLGPARDQHKLAQQFLEPSESRRYQLKLRVLNGAVELRALAKHDGPVAPVRTASA